MDALAPELVVNCDRRQIVSALFNLLENAVKYSDGNGEAPRVDVPFPTPEMGEPLDLGKLAPDGSEDTSVV